MISVTVGHHKRRRRHQLHSSVIRHPRTLEEDRRHRHHQCHSECCLRSSASSSLSECHQRHQLLLSRNMARGPLIKDASLIPFVRPSHEHMKLESMVRRLRGVLSLCVLASILQGPPSSAINAGVVEDYFAEYCLLGFSSTSGPGFLSIASSLNLLSNPGIASKVERFIRNQAPFTSSMV